MKVIQAIFQLLGALLLLLATLGAVGYFLYFIIALSFVCLKMIVEGIVERLVSGWESFRRVFHISLIVPTYKVYSSNYVRKLETYLALTRNELLVFESAKKSPEMATLALVHLKKVLHEIEPRLAKMDDSDFLHLSSLILDWKEEMSKIHFGTKT